MHEDERPRPGIPAARTAEDARNRGVNAQAFFDRSVALLCREMEGTKADPSGEGS